MIETEKVKKIDMKMQKAVDLTTNLLKKSEILVKKAVN